MPRPKIDLSSSLKKLFERRPGLPSTEPKALFQRPAPPSPARTPVPSGKTPDARVDAPAGVPVVAAPRQGTRLPGVRTFYGWISKRLERGQPVIGMDLGASSVKLARLESGGGRLRLTGTAVEDLPLGVTEGPGWEEAVRGVLQRFRKQKFFNGRIVLGFYHSDAVIESIRMPKMPAGELNQAILWEVKERLSLSPERSVIRYVVNGEVSVDGQPQLEILIITTPRVEVLARWKFLAEMGLRVVAVEPVSLAGFYSLLRLNSWKPTELVGILELGMKVAHLSFVRGEAVRFSRSFQVAGDSFTRAIADYCQLDYSQGEQLKRQYGMSRMALEEDRQQPGHSAEDRVRVSHALGLHLEKLVAEIEHSFRYFVFELGGSESQKMDRLILTGGGGLLRNLSEFLSNRLSVPVVSPNPLEGFEMDAAVRAAVQSEWSQRMAVPLGLALRTME